MHRGRSTVPAATYRFKSSPVLYATHEVCDRHNDVATASLIENWIDETERRTWFLAEIRSDL
jgi:DNA-binding ferritin-like protein